MAESSTSQEIKVVIVGAQFGGLAFLHAFLKTLGSPKHFPQNVSITVIDVKEFMYINYAGLRNLCNFENWNTKLMLPLKECFGEYKVDINAAPSSTSCFGGSFKDNAELKFVQGKVTEVKKDEVVLADGKVITFNYLVIATGSTYRSPFKFSVPTIAEASAEVKVAHEKIKAAKSILIVGAGAVGCELAGELKHFFPDKKVILISSGPKLLNDQIGGLLDKVKDKTAATLTGMGVELVLNERVNLEMPEIGYSEIPSLKTDKDRELLTDLQFVCAGCRVNSALAKTLNVLDEKNQIKVNEFFQVEGFPNIFAIGDVANLSAPKVGYLAEAQGTMLGKNLGKHVSTCFKSKTPLAPFDTKKVKPYTGPSFFAMIMCFGPKMGVVQMGSIIEGNKTAATLKGGNLFVPKVWKSFNLPTPM